MTNHLSPAARDALSYPLPGAWMPLLPAGVARLSAGYPFPESVPVTGLLQATGGLLTAEQDLPLHYLGSPSMAALPGLLGRRMAQRGMPVGEGELLVTSGACQAIDLAARALLGPDDLVAVEAPTYMEALEIFRNYTPHIVSYAVDEQGLDVAELAADLSRRRAAGAPLPKALYTIASFQNPTGATLSLERRRLLLALAAEYGFIILEDDAYGELSFDAGAPPPLKALDGADRVLYLGSLSKVVAPGLRIGWVAGLAPLVQAMGVFKKDLDHPLGWSIAARYLTDLDLEARLAWLRQAYRQRRDFLLAELTREMPAGVTWTTPAGGFFLWVTLPPGQDTAALLPAALEAGVAYVPGRYFYFDQEAAGASRCLRLSFSYLPLDEIARGVKALAGVLRQAGLG